VTPSVDLRSHLIQAPSPRLFVALWGGMAVVDLARAGQASPTLQVALLAALAGLCSLHQRIPTALAVAGVVWLVALGFVVNTSGELILTGSGDAVRGAVITAVALAVTAVRR